VSTDYEASVFINCPFDSHFQPLFEAILFTVYKCGLKPRCALEHDDAGETRIDKINSIIYDCKYGIHDISRTELDSFNNLPRFNMPLELGLFLGCKKFAKGKSSEKITIIFDSEKYRYMQFISDIAGQDIKTHKNNPKTLIQNLRSGFNTNLGGGLPGATAIYNDYKAYQSLKPEIKKFLNLHDDDELTYSDHVQIIQQWMRINS